MTAPKTTVFPDALLDGYDRFMQGRYRDERSRYRELAAAGQKPHTLIVACCDSRAAPETVFNAGPGELFVMEWRALIEEEVGGPSWDSSAWVNSDDGWQVTIGLRPHEVFSQYESVSIPIEPGVFHDYRLTSSDMRTYELYIDGELARAGTFWQGLTAARISWGPVADGVSSLSQWDYVRVGVVPEPASRFLFLVLCAIKPRRRQI